MDIERINENTLKLFITYSDIEDRGYSREEIWYNRSKGEELFWDVISEVNTDDYFDLEGPIWIHINASEQGLEVIVTRANMGMEGESLMQNFEENRDVAAQLREMEESIYETTDSEEQEEESILLSARFKFKDIDELIPVAKRIVAYGTASSLYKMENEYFLSVDFTTVNDARERRNALAILKEYLQPTRITIHRIEEYGIPVMPQDCFETVIQYFA
ncbi:adaptor protein MecA [Solibacillus sp. CAU 1738]|uniref:adaptor protein MecA n=1 Tax=Solibacillus sp. CAU 1738 TaxID=3140363 RepID=UPI0032609019